MEKHGRVAWRDIKKANPVAKTKGRGAKLKDRDAPNARYIKSKRNQEKRYDSSVNRSQMPSGKQKTLKLKSRKMANTEKGRMTHGGKKKRAGAEPQQGQKRSTQQRKGKQRTQ